MEYTKRELHHLALCLGHCATCSEATKCTLKKKVEQDEQIDSVIYDALANYYSMA